MWRVLPHIPCSLRPIPALHLTHLAHMHRAKQLKITV